MTILKTFITISVFCKRKKCTFILFIIETQGEIPVNEAKHNEN
jgi:hypothetical protein